MATQTILKVIPFRPEHLDVVETDPSEIGHISGLSDYPARLQAFADGSKFAGTFSFKGRILCCAGFFDHWPGVAEGWMFPTVHIHDHPIVYLRSAKRYMTAIMKTFKYHRMETTCLDDEAHAKWMEFLGFAPEGLRRKFTWDQRDFRLYARTT